MKTILSYIVVVIVSTALLGCQSIPPELRNYVDKAGRHYIEKTYPTKPDGLLPPD